MRTGVGVGIAVFAVIGAGVVWAQQTAPGVDGSLAGLTAEVRALRLAVEESGRRQTETQAVAVYLSAQQNRMTQLSQRLESVRTELSQVKTVTAQAAKMVATAQEASASARTAQERAEAAEMLTLFKQQHAQGTENEARLQARELELYQAIKQDETRWTELIGRLESAIRR